LSSYYNGIFPIVLLFREENKMVTCYGYLEKQSTLKKIRETQGKSFSFSRYSGNFFCKTLSEPCITFPAFYFEFLDTSFFVTLKSSSILVDYKAEHAQSAKSPKKQSVSVNF